MTVDFKYKIGQTVFFKNPFLNRDNRNIEEGTITEQLYDGNTIRYRISCNNQCVSLTVAENELVAKGKDLGLDKAIPILQELVFHIKERTVEKQHFEFLVQGGKITIDV